MMAPEVEAWIMAQASTCAARSGPTSSPESYLEYMLGDPDRVHLLRAFPMKVSCR